MHNIDDIIEQKFRTALGEESDHPLSDELYHLILDNCETLTFQKGEPIVDIGKIDPDIYIIRKGIVRGYMVNDGVEANMYFGMEGTMLSSMQSFSAGKPSILRIEACCTTTMLRMRKSVYDDLCRSSIGFCIWTCGVFTRRACLDELKAKVMNGDASWRYKWLERCRPELFDNVPLKAIASYLKMTEVHISRIRRKIMKNKPSFTEDIPDFLKNN